MAAAAVAPVAAVAVVAPVAPVVAVVPVAPVVATPAALRRAQVCLVHCEEGRGSPCQRTTSKYTVGHVEDHGVPYWNCMEANRHHWPRVRGW
jgi:hypothetical protein